MLVFCQVYELYLYQIIPNNKKVHLFDLYIGRYNVLVCTLGTTDQCNELDWN